MGFSQSARVALPTLAIWSIDLIFLITSLTWQVGSRFADKVKLPLSRSKRVTSELSFTSGGGLLVRGSWSKFTAPSESEMSCDIGCLCGVKSVIYKRKKDQTGDQHVRRV
jgi:hypothetical protein